jgi:hypothetical protein
MRLRLLLKGFSILEKQRQRTIRFSVSFVDEATGETMLTMEGWRIMGPWVLLEPRSRTYTGSMIPWVYPSARFKKLVKDGLEKVKEVVEYLGPRPPHDMEDEHEEQGYYV